MRVVMLRIAVLLVALWAPTAASAQWEEVPGFGGRFFDEVFFTDITHGWAAESYSPNIVYTTDGGMTWSTGVLPNTTGSKMRDLCFVDRSMGFATGSDGLFRTIDGGRSWSNISPIAFGTIPAVWFRDADEGVIGLGACDGDQALFMHTTDGGVTWTSAQYTVDLDASVGGIRYDESTGAWYAAGGEGKIWTSVDGENWALFNSGSEGWQEDIDVVDGTIFTASTDAGSCENDGGGYLLVLQRDSTQWVRSKPLQTYPFWSVSALSQREAWAAGDEGHIYHTTDGGWNWMPRACGLTGADHVDDIDFVDATHGWAVGDGIFRYTGDVDILAVSVTPSLTICAGSPVQLEASGGEYYLWQPATGLSDPNVANPIATPDATTTYTVSVMSERGCTGTASVTITVGGAGAGSLELPEVTADVRDDNVEIPIRMIDPAVQSACDPETASITVAFNGSLFYPRSVTRGRIASSTLVGSERRVTIELGREDFAAAGDVVTTIVGNAMLGNALETPITVTSMIWNGTPITPDIAPGRLALTGVCSTANGPRLLNPSGFGINKIAPNPASGPVSVAIRSGGPGIHVVDVYSRLGELLSSTPWESTAADQEHTIALPGELQSGAYEVVLRSGTHRDTETLFITK